MQNISQQRTIKPSNYNVTSVRNSKAPKSNVILTSSKYAVVTKQECRNWDCNCDIKHNFNKVSK